MQHYPDLKSILERYELGMAIWTSAEEIGRVDQWIESNEPQIQGALMGVARIEKHLITEMNCEP